MGKTDKGSKRKKDPDGTGAVAENTLLNAGCFSSWLRRFRHALLTDTGIEVPCGSCRACCTSSYFIHIRPEEKKTLSRIHKQLLFSAPGLPKGNMLLGHFSDGSCPMLKDSGCMIYNVRPKTCHIYDCRIFAAAGIKAGSKEKRLVNQQVEKWIFSYPTDTDRLQHDAVRTAAWFMLHKVKLFPEGFVPDNPSLLAVSALRVFPVFMPQPVARPEDLARETVQEYIQQIIKENRRFTAACK